MSEAPVTEAPVLSDVERVIYERLADCYDVPIAVLYHAAFGVAHALQPKSSRCQMRLGSYISKINRKLKSTTGEEIVPGQMKRTYRLTRV